MNDRNSEARKLNSKEHFKGLILIELRRIKELEGALKDHKYHLDNLSRQLRAADH